MANRYMLVGSLAAAFTVSALTETQARWHRPPPPPPPAACTPSMANRPLKPAQQLYGVTLDDVSNISGELDSLTNLPHLPATRIYFDPAVNVGSYIQPLQTFYPMSYIMGEMADSSDMPNFTVTSITAQANNLVSKLGPCVDIWEVGNEVNGNWLLNNATSAALTMAKIEAMYNAVAFSTNPNLRSKLTALTFFYEGEPSDRNNCIATDNGGNDMFTWIQTNFLSNPTSETEAI